MSIYSISLLCFAFGVFLIAVLAIFKRRDAIGIRFAFFSLSCMGWAVFASFWFSQSYDKQTSLYLTRISHASAAFIAITWVHFVLTLINKRGPFKAFYPLCYSLAFVFLLLTPFPIFISGVKSVLDFKYFTEAGPLYHFFTVYYLTLVNYGIYYLVKEFLRSTGQRRDQLRYLVYGTFIGFLAGSSTLFPIYDLPVSQKILIFMPLYPLLTGIGLIRYGLFDVHEIASAFHREKLAAIGALSASINHEIKNPLYIIQGTTQSHLEGMKHGFYSSKDEALLKANEALHVSAQQANRAMEIMKRFAVFARQNNNSATYMESVKLNETLENILPMINRELELDKITLEKSVSQDLSPVRADKRQVEEILFNLIVNSCQAFKAMDAVDHVAEEGEYQNTGKSDGEIQKSRYQREKSDALSSEFSFCSSDSLGLAFPGESFPHKISITAAQHNGHVRLTVADNGPGIPKDKLKNIFEPFYTTKREGTGLGLYVTKQLVEKNGGRIAVKSEPGKGTGFEITFNRS